MLFDKLSLLKKYIINKLFRKKAPKLINSFFN